MLIFVFTGWYPTSCGCGAQLWWGHVPGAVRLALPPQERKDSDWPCMSENGYLVTVECWIIPNHPRMLSFKVSRKHSWFQRSWRSNRGQNEVESLWWWHMRKIWAKIELCAKEIPNPMKTVTANPPPFKFSRRNAPFIVQWGFGRIQIIMVDDK